MIYESELVETPLLDEKYPQNEHRSTIYNDVGFIAIFMIQLALVAGSGLSLGFQGLFNSNNPEEVFYNDEGEEYSSDESIDSSPVAIVFSLCLLLVLATLSSVVWVQVATRFSHLLITGMMLSTASIVFVLSLALFVAGSFWTGLLFLAISASSALYFFFVRHRIAFASANLKVACTAINTLPYTVFVALVMTGVQVLWSLLWLLAVYGWATNATTTTVGAFELSECTTYSYASSLLVPLYPSSEDPLDPMRDIQLDCHGNDCHACVCFDAAAGTNQLVKGHQACITSSLSTTRLLLLLLSFFWTSSVIANIVHCTTSGSVGLWWYKPPHSPTSSIQIVREALQRALTTSLGSIIFGSLLVAIVRVCQQVVSLLKTKLSAVPINNPLTLKVQRFLLSALSCLLRVLLSLLTIFNRYAFVYVSLYGFAFIPSGKKATALFHTRGWDAIVNDDLIDNALSLGVVLVAIVSSSIGLLLSSLFQLSVGDSTFLAVAGFGVGYAVCLVVLKVVSSAVCTVFVCFAQDWEVFEKNHPLLAQTLISAWWAYYGDEMKSCGISEPVYARQGREERKGGGKEEEEDDGFMDDVTHSMVEIHPLRKDGDRMV